MINFFIENNILMIVLLSLFIIIELVIFKATEDNYASQRKTQRISATIPNPYSFLNILFIEIGQRITAWEIGFKTVTRKYKISEISISRSIL